MGRVVFLTREFPPDTLWGGEAVACYDMARILVGMGHKIHVICQAIGKQKDFIDENGIFIHRVGRNPKRYSIIARIDYSFHAIKKLSELTKKYNIDVVEGFYGGSETFLYILFKLLGMFKAPFILHAHGSIRHAILDTKSYRGVIGLLAIKFLLYLADFTARRSNIVVTISPVIYNELLNETKVNSQKLRLILTPRNTEDFKPVKTNIREKLGLGIEDKLVLTVGRLEPRKGIHILCKAIPIILQLFPNTKFVFIGRDTPTSPKKDLTFKEFLITEILKEYTKNVIFIEFVSNVKLLELYSAADVVVSPSLYEISTSVPIEAMACGKPVVVTYTGTACLLQLDGTNGIIVPPRDPQKLAEAIIKMLSLSDEEKKVVSEKNRKIIQQVFSYNRWISEIKRLHDDVIA
jgi:glycosyltransferase involved in cell wall biosynthesis